MCTFGTHINELAAILHLALIDTNMQIRTKYLILLLSLIFIALSLYTIHESEFTSTTVKDITVMIISFSSLIVALLLYDRFDYRKVIYKKKLDLVIDLLIALKSLSFHVRFSNKNGEYAAFFEINRTHIKSLSDLEYSNFPVCFTENYKTNYYQEILPFLNNPFLPKEVSDSLEFLSIKSHYSVNNKPNFKEDYVRLFLTKDSYEDDDNVLWFVDTTLNVTLKTYSNDLCNCLDIIESWIDKHSDIKSELNI